MKAKEKRSRGIFLKITLTFTLLGVLIVLLGSQFLFQGLSRYVSEIVTNNFAQMVKSVSDSLTDMLETYDTSSGYLYEYSSNNHLYLKDYLKSNQVSSQDRNAFIRMTLQAILYTDQDIESVRFVDNQGQIYYVFKDSIQIIDESQMRKSLGMFENEDKKALLLIPTYPTSQFSKNNGDYVFSLVRNYMDTSSLDTVENNVLGTLFIDVNANKLPAILNNYDWGGTSVSILDLQSGSTLFHNQSEFSQMQPFLDTALLDKMVDNQGILVVGDKNYVYSKIEKSSWMIVVELNQQEINQYFNNATWYFIIFMAVLSFLFAVVYSVFGKRATEPVRILKNAMIKIQQGDLDTRVSIKGKDEMAVLGEGLNSMAKNLKLYMDRVYIAEIRQKEAELDALKVTIKPHYLYNTLEVIRMKAVLADDSAVAKMLESLSGQLKYLIGYTGDYVTLREEIDNVRDYFNIIQIRFEHRYSIEFQIPKELEQQIVLKLILQPVVENAVNHGLRRKEGKGRVLIDAKVVEGNLVISVMDDGAGISPEKLTKIQESLHCDSEDMKSTDGIGIKNVHERIQHRYGKKYGIQIVSYENVGTNVLISLPMKDERINNDDESFDCG